MSKALSIVGLVLGSASIVATILIGMVLYRFNLVLLILMFSIGIIAIVFGIIGIIKDVPLGMKIAGVVLGSASLGFILVVFFLLRYVDYVW
ncbi:MAG: hypothetical protein ACFFCI_16270 [Promethearchaeota archaeon]